MTREIGVEEAAKSLEEFLPVDVREEQEFHGPLGHVPGAVLHPLGSLPAALADLPRDRRMLLVCRSGKRSRRACERLEEIGFADVTNLAGGMIAWNEAGLPVERGAFSSIPAVIENVIAYVAQVTPTPPAAVRQSLEDLLEEAGSSFETPSSAAMEWALQELADSLRSPVPPADLDLVLVAWRRDLAVL